ncbi:MAG TPA: VOC family protein [Acidimicrobiia bacterium]|nr:VOC family protein [Acidimicrobiia bacterium]
MAEAASRSGGGSRVTPNLRHVGVYVWDIERMTRFYTRAFGLEVTDRGRGNAFPHDLVFLSSEPGEHHQLVLVSGRPPDAEFSTVMQLSFKVDTLAELRGAAAHATAEGATDLFGLNHGNAWSVYCNDPEGNTVEVYTDTPWYVPQPFGHPLDLEKSDEVIYADTEAECRATPGYLPRAEWMAGRATARARS